MNLEAFEGDPVELKWNAKDLHSLEQVLRFVPGRHAAVQAGGCLGVFASRLAIEFGAVYVFEPDPGLFRMLVKNVQAENVVKLQAALGIDRRLVQTVCTLRTGDGKTTLHQGMTRTEPAGFIPTLRIDDLALPKCDLIYLDIEGDELFALRGASVTLARCKPVVVCEVNRGIRYRGLSEDDLRNHMRLMDYRTVAKFRSDELFVHKDAVI